MTLTPLRVSHSSLPRDTGKVLTFSPSIHTRMLTLAPSTLAMSLRAVRKVHVVPRSRVPTTYLLPDLPITARSRVEVTVMVAFPGQYFIGRKTALRSLIQPQAPLTFLTRPSGRIALTARWVSTTPCRGSRG